MPAVRSTTGAKSKASEARGKTKAPVASTSAIGAPAQYKQTNRKGKKAWRKNIDIQSEEQALEKVREIEQVLGPQSTSTGSAPFVIDVEGDAEIRRKVKTRPVLRSLAILSQRSAMPALSAKARPAQNSSERVHKQPKLSTEEKERLLRIARKGAVRALDGMGMGSASLATKGVEAADLKDVWGADGTAVVDSPPPQPEEWGYEARLSELKPHAPVTFTRQRELQNTLSTSKTLPIPDSGISYNPKLEKYQALLEQAVQEEMERLEMERQEEERVEKYRLLAKLNARPTQRGDAAGMTVAAGDQEAIASEGLEPEQGDQVFRELLKIKATTRKTQADRNRIARRKAADQAIKQAREAKQLRAHLASLPSIKAQVEARMKADDQAEERRRLRDVELAKTGIVPGQRVGKHKMQDRRVEVQLGEDLSETMRQIKPEGNLFRDRFLSLQQRALIEPRVRQMPTKRQTKIKEYEKHDFKRFDRE
ncbi:hypothetical protein QFC22_003310 [Naganishia vaughanmartiniae]|uniref:Uncharacterized protein n=1 Tax=Naganishia vaughanmartiniae TaxID=1424756 RepID=A0ACC2X7G0_9TREE|nr:hypothetical protein QFC22_003310 [Naganishia vaughanmartiniae]